MLVVFLYIFVFEYVLYLPQSVQSLSNESMNSKVKYWRYNTLWKPNEDTEDYKKILSNFLSTMSELKSLRTAVVTVTNYIDPFFMNDYYVDMFSQRSQLTWTTTRFRNRNQVLTRFPYRHRSPNLSNSISFRLPNLHTKMMNTHMVSYEENDKYQDYWLRQQNSKPVIPHRRTSTSIVKYYSTTHNFKYRPEFETNRIQSHETPMFRAYFSKPNQPYKQATYFSDVEIPIERQRKTTIWNQFKTPSRTTTTEYYKSSTISVTPKVFNFPSPSTKNSSLTPVISTTDTTKIDSTFYSKTSTTKKWSFLTTTPYKVSDSTTTPFYEESDTTTTPYKVSDSTTTPFYEESDTTTTPYEESDTTSIDESSPFSNSKDNVRAYCYMCGLNLTGIPRAPTCYDVFDSTEKSPSSSIRRYKVHCITKKTNKTSNRNEFVGNVYRKGCFKRFTDIGMVYNERGCRTMRPTEGKSFASHRFAKLELLLAYKDEGCVHSPHASLTPFSRAISLYVRYHVCVCKGRYCNHATHLSEPPSATLYLILISTFLYLNYFI